MVNQFMVYCDRPFVLTLLRRENAFFRVDIQQKVMGSTYFTLRRYYDGMGRQFLVEQGSSSPVFTLASTVEYTYDAYGGVTLLGYASRRDPNTSGATKLLLDRIYLFQVSQSAMNRYRTLIFCITMWALAFALVACIPSIPSREDIIGLWIEYPTGNKEPSLCGSFYFFEDGHFEANNIPGEYFMSVSNERINADGTWELDISSNNPLAVHSINLVFAPIKGFPLGFDDSMFITIEGKGLFAGMDNSVLFTREGGKCK